MQRQLLFVLAAVGLVGAGAWIDRSFATGAPTQTPLTYAGVVTAADGKVLPTAVDVTVAFYDAPTGGALKCKAPTVQSEAGTGRFSVVLPAECAAAVHDKTDLWSEAAVGPGQVLLPRVHVGAVPYALESDSAKVSGAAAAASGALAQQLADLKAKVDGLGGGGGAGGGGFYLYDGADVELGKLVDIARDPQYWYTSWATAMTPKGYFLTLRLDGDVPFFGVYYDGLNCSGKAYGDPLYASPKFKLGKTLIPDKMGNGWLTPMATTPSVKPETVFYKSFMNPGGVCESSGVNGQQNSVPLSKISNADAGVPDVITPGLYFKAK